MLLMPLTQLIQMYRILLQIRIKIRIRIRIKIKVPIGQVPAQVPVQPVPQPVPVQPAPAGVMPVPQIIYQNWIGKKLKFSGKLEEDVESHLLSTRDWMEAHNFPEGEKVRHFRVTLIGEARLWYESLALLDNDWPHLTKQIQVAILQNRQYPRTIVSCLEDFQI